MKKTILLLGTLFLFANSSFSNGTNEVTLSFAQLNAASVALADFKNVKTMVDQKEYSVSVQEVSNNVVVTFSPPLTVLGGGHIYVISKDTGKVLKISGTR